MNPTFADTARIQRAGRTRANNWVAHRFSGGGCEFSTHSCAPRLEPGITHFRLLAATVVVLACVWGVGPRAARAADTLSPERQRELVRETLNAFDEAVQIARDDPAGAEVLYRSSVAALETLSDHGVRNAALEYNLGNAYFRLGELGRAIVHYRRAQRLDPTDAALAANLDYARNRVEPYIRPTGTRQLITRLMFWTNHVSIQNRFWLSAVASVAGWLGLMLRLKWRSRPLAVLATLAILLGVANAASVAGQLHDEARHPPAVVGGERVLRLGRGEGYDPAITRPLGPGVELRILSERGDWGEVQLPDAKTGWLPLEALERI